MSLPDALFAFTFVFGSLVLVSIGLKGTLRDIRDWQSARIQDGLGEIKPNRYAQANAGVRWSKATASRN